MPTISVIVPVYNVEKYIHRCIDSILAQTFADFELLLVDDGSPDNCGAICDEYATRDRRVRVFHQENKGQAAARNLALDWMYANSDSQYVSFVDSDDWVHPKYLELLYRALQEYGTNISQCRHMERDGSEEMPQVEERDTCVTVEEQYCDHYSALRKAHGLFICPEPLKSVRHKSNLTFVSRKTDRQTDDELLGLIGDGVQRR